MSLVLDAGSLKKIKVVLTDYSHAQDIAHRLKLHRATAAELLVLEEILFSSIKTTYQKLLESTYLEPEVLDNALLLFKETGLIKEEADALVIDKELRKFFELEIERFSEDFEPGIDFLAQLLKKVPIHILPAWYALPRTSTNIFESIIEKYLHTPQLYQRLLSETQTHEPQLKQLIDLLFTSDRLELELDFLKNHLNVTDEVLFEWLSILEFNLIGSVFYKKQESGFKGYLTPLSEFKNYLIHLRQTEASTLPAQEVQKITLAPFAYIEGLFTLLKCCKQKIYNYPLSQLQDAELKEALAENNLAYLELEELMQKLVDLHFLEIKNGQLLLNETSLSFMAMKPESAALVLYRHPLNRPHFTLAIPVEKAIRECEKAACRLIGKDWVLYDEFVKGIVVPFCDDQQIVLKKAGRRWQYHLPSYTKADCEFIQHMFSDWFEKVGVIETGFFAKKPCLRLTALGTEIFS